MRIAKSLGIVFFCSLCIPLAGCSEDLPADQQTDYKDIEELIEETNVSKHKVHGSCNIIATGSHCLDYIGSYWENKEFMRLSCEGMGEESSDGTFSENACPYTDVGGCQITAGTIMETIMWAYNEGGSPITPEVAPYEQMACNATAASQWVLPEF